MSLKIQEYILNSRHYKGGDTFKANDIQTMLSGRRLSVKIDTVRDALNSMRQAGLLSVLPRNSPDESLVYMRAVVHNTFPDGIPTLQRPWRKRHDIPDHSPRYY